MDLRPGLNWALGEQETIYDSPAGRWESAWKILDTTHVEVRVTVPFGCEALLTLPCTGEEAYGDLTGIQDGKYRLMPGSYTFRYETNRPLKPVYNTRTPVIELWENRAVWEALTAVLPAEQSPRQYWDVSLRDIAEKFGGTDDKQLDRLDDLLAQF